MPFVLKSNYQPAGDQPQAIEEISTRLQEGEKNQVLLGVTGSGKTYTMANVIQKVQKPTLVIAHNKTLAGQLYQEFRDFFPDNAVSYFVSYYDYYQPEAYIVSSDTYIEKEATINEEIDKLRLASTANLLSRPDSIVVASVSCIYSLGKPEDFALHQLVIVEGELLSRQTIITRLTDMQYQRTTADLLRGTFRIRGDLIQVWPANEEFALNISLPSTKIEKIEIIHPTTGTKWDGALPFEPGISRRYTIYPAKHYIASGNLTNPLADIEQDMRQRVEELKAQNKIVEAYRLEQRTLHDLDLLRETGFVNGIENYSRYFDGRQPGKPPYTLLDYFNYNARTFGDGSYLTIVDESHITMPQVRGMYFGDQSRKETLVEYGFRLPAAIDNRPLKLEEFLERVDQTVFVSATPNEWELERSKDHVTQLIVRPTGLVDPPVEIRPIANQIPDLIFEILQRKERGQRALVTTLTKKMAEVLTSYLNDKDRVEKLLRDSGYEELFIREMPKVQYLHSDVETLERSEILEQLRKGEYDVLIGVNLLREGLDLPEVTLVAILDADQEGFLRSTSALIQTMGRAARHVEGRVILYADVMTRSIQAAIAEVDRRRQIQTAYNEQHGITPQTISKPIREQLIKRDKEEETLLPGMHEPHSRHQQRAKSVGVGKTEIELNKQQSLVLEDLDPLAMTPSDKKKVARQLTRVMNQAAKDWKFELAAKIRDTIARLEE